VTEPRIYQGSPLAEVPLEWLCRRDPVPPRWLDKATEVAPGVRVLVLAWGDMLRPDGTTVSRGARIAVWREDGSEPPVIDMGYLSAPAEVQAGTEEQAAGQKPGGSMNPTPDCGGPRKPPGATEVWWCGAHGEFHGVLTEEESCD
jgi:hypothetical protein